MLTKYLWVKDHIRNLILSNIRITTLSDRFLNCLAIAENYITIRDAIMKVKFVLFNDATGTH